MSALKLAIVYYSSTGNNYKLARMAEEAGKANGAEVKVMKVQELAPEAAINGNPLWKAHVEETKDVPVVTLDDLQWADAVLFSMPTRFGNMPAQMKQFLDTTGGLWFQGKLINKVVSAMTSAQNDHGGQEATILSLYTTMYHWGAIIAAPGYTDPVLFTTGGNPYGTSVTVDQHGNMRENVQPAVAHQVKRMLEIAEKINR
ncbi:NAD(P)H:quinone oxidoreductase [Paenibacillus sp.]|uniref:NAD(P)H:quinone oxidoreductase n=1 Tax=Paenibacillus sp. TaxID=58172 RepID=UPI002D54EE78|nr:NAD(P)H:quinone oxidoreductase [Paenibacillus sp.]HZG57062.1 NAD(P)H:quinone oxidoreductase [Paenibacillus sp.]